MVWGAWEDFLINKPEWKHSFDVVIMAETLYNKEYYMGLLKLIENCLK